MAQTIERYLKTLINLDFKLNEQNIKRSLLINLIKEKAKDLSKEEILLIIKKRKGQIKFYDHRFTKEGLLENFTVLMLTR